ncbi:MAG: serine/threonine-protein kinase [Blastocatellia bacterium]
MKECPKCKSCYEDILAECPIDNTELDDGVPGPTILAGKFRVESRLGKGGMGSVYQAMHLGLKRYVALKTLLPQNQSQGDFAERFRREAQVFGRVKHPNIVDVMDFGFAEVGREKVAYLAMEFLEGSTLKDLIKKQGRISEKQTIAIMSQVCQAVDAAHKAGVIHRDLKPDNIWLENKADGTYKVKVLDFGIAKVIDSEEDEQQPNNLNNNTISKIWRSSTNNKNTGGGKITALQNDTGGARVTNADGIATEAIDAGTEDLDYFGTEAFRDSVEQLTQTGAMIGTLPYMSPEQCLSKPISPATDIYALGIISYEMLTGQRPFRGKSYEVVIQHVKEIPEAPSKLLPEIPKSTENAILHALKKQPLERPLSANAFGVELAQNLIEQERKRKSIKKMLRLGIAAAAVLSITAIITNWDIVSDKLNNLGVSAGIAKAAKDYQSYSQLKIVSLENGKEELIANTSAITIKNETASDTTKTLEPNELENLSLSKKSNKFLAKLSPDQRLIAYLPKKERNADLVVWDLVENKKILSVSLKSLPEQVKDIVFSPNSDKILFSSVNYVYQQNINIQQDQALTITTTFENNNFIQPASLDLDKLIVVSVREPVASFSMSGLETPLKETNSLISLWKNNASKITDLVHKQGKVEFIYTSITPEKTWLLAQWQVSKTEPSRQIELWDLAEMTAAKRLWSANGLGGCAISKDGKKVALKLENNKLTEMDLSNFTQIKEYSLDNLSKLKSLFYTEVGDLLLVVDEKVENLSQNKTLYSAPKNTSILLAKEKFIIVETSEKQEVSPTR